MTPCRTLPELFAAAHGGACVGSGWCQFCGAAAAELFALPDSFTTRDVLRRPGSGFRCAGCRLCMEEAGEAVYPDGSRYHFTKAFRRMCSWVVTPAGVVAATKAHGDYLRETCLRPPAPPFGISIAASGQKQVLFLGVVNHTRDHVTVTLEGERIGYRPADLAERLALCGRVSAATGKPALAEPPTPSLWFRVCDRYAAGEAVCASWERLRLDPLTRLASYLCPKKEDCEREHPGDRHGGVPPAGVRPAGPAQGPDGGRGGRGRQGRREATLFDAV